MLLENLCDVRLRYVVPCTQTRIQQLENAYTNRPSGCSVYNHRINNCYKLAVKKVRLSIEVSVCCVCFSIRTINS